MDCSLTGNYAVLAKFAESVQVGELSPGLRILAELGDEQLGDLISFCVMMLDRVMANEIPGAPARLSTFEGIGIPRVAENKFHGCRTDARRFLVSTWYNEAEEFVSDLEDLGGIAYAAGVVALGTGGMLLTWQLATDQALEAILGCIRLSGRVPVDKDDDLGPEAHDDEPESKPPVLASEPKHAAEPELFIPPNMKQPVTINMRTALKLRAETAVLRTGHLPGGYRSQVMLIEAALEQELTRLEAEFNSGELFPPNVGSFRTGRPLGS
ncbi:hypothetical protein CVV68_01175 [Arthrobacter livingstonensis]|uniref:Uncharacterized protein n=1 Tax=Arthrobacter livingstonensis TaxID=670078 RepID=A0A2V5LP45_9MICC|nr:hypothetical protein CVV68_01175 [Arthrobacter livingstonensis]